jgi:hypothetical protein
MLLIAAAAIAASSPQTAPAGAATASVQATATIRIVSAVRLSFGSENSSSDIPRPRRTNIVTSDGQEQPASLIEFQ